MQFWWSLCTSYLLACQMRVTVGDSLVLCSCDVVVVVDRFYVALFSALERTHCFYSAFLNIRRSGVLCCRLGAFCVHLSPYNQAPCHFMQSYIHKVHGCLAVTCLLHLWQNDRDLLRATAVTQGWNGYGNMSQHRKLTLEKKILPPLLPGFEPATFQSGVRRSNH